MLKKIEYHDYCNAFVKQLPKGAFLNVKGEEKVNPMTIAWATIGFLWHKPVLMVVVRYSRYTYDLLEKSKEFTVSVPLDDSLKKALLICGTKSGREIDKIKECH
ncbi:MAG: flavin reductase, partial [Spirochaetes bacterium]|nr:flavin reductase [Spirochaetota bacterium]